MTLAFSFVDCHLGYRLNRLFVENVGKAQRENHENSGVWKITQRFADGERALSVMTRKDAYSVSGSIGVLLFQYEEPKLGLRESEKHLLVEALTRRSDVELAKAMNLSPATIKKRWQALFERIADTHPEMLPVGEKNGGSESRGPQKRHHILTYVGSHPQELRPFRWRTMRHI
jgi:hypothetical protein